MEGKNVMALAIVVTALLGAVGGHCICEYQYVGQDYEMDRLNEKVSVLEEQINFSERILESKLSTASFKGWSKGVDDIMGTVATKPPTGDHDILGNCTFETGVTISLAREDGGWLYAWQTTNCCHQDTEKCVEKS